MPLNPSIALGAQAPTQAQNPLSMLAQILQIQQLKQSGTLAELKAQHEQEMLPLLKQKMEAEIRNIPAQEEQRRTAAAAANIKMMGDLQQQQGRTALTDYFNPQSQNWSQGAQPNQVFSTEADALKAAMDADAKGQPFRMVANPSRLQALLSQADPSAFVRSQTAAMNRPPEMPQVVPAGAGLRMPGEVTPQYTQPFAPRVTPTTKPPTGFRFTSDGESLEPIPGGPRDKPNALPAFALKLQQNDLEAIGTSGSINADLASLSKQIDDKKLDLGLISNLISRGRNLTDYTDSETSRNYASFRASIEKLRNDSLRLNKGVQTEGDSVRAWNELVSNLNNNQVVKQRLGEIQKINERAINIRRMNIDSIRSNYGLEPMDTSRYEAQPAAVGNSSGGAQTTPRPVTAQDAAALSWANANPNDPRAAAIKQRLGVR